jgi:large subunit ribosomal protein L15
MPLTRRIPKFGFTNIFRVEYQIVNTARLQELADGNRISGDITPDMLFEIGAVSSRKLPIKILGNGELKAKLNITAHGFSESAKQKIEQAGGKAILHG